MKSNKKLLFLTALFVAGFSLAWMMKHSQAPAAPEQVKASMRISSAGGKPATESHPESDARTKSLVRDYLADLSPAIGKNDYRKMIEELMRNPDGEEEYWIQMKVEKLVSDWYVAAPHAALHWVLTQRNPDSTSSLLTVIIGRVAEMDVDEALALAKRYGTDDGRSLDMPEQLVSKLGGADAENFLRMMSHFTGEGGQSGRPIEYGEGFDFQRALDGLKDLNAALGPDSNLSFMPSNLLTEWAKQDWDAAWKWALAGKEIADNGPAELAKSVAATYSTEEYAGLAAFVTGAAAIDTESKGHQVWDILSERASPELIASYLQQAPGGRQENLTKLLAASFYYGGDGYDDAQKVLLWQMTAAERVAAFQSEPVQSQMDTHDREKYHSMLRRLGHSDEEIRLTLPSDSK